MKGYVCARTSALRSARRFRPDGRKLTPGKQHPPSPPAFWVWYDEFLTKDEKDSLDYALHGDELQFNYRFLCATRWNECKTAIARVLALGQHPYMASSIRPGMINQ